MVDSASGGPHARLSAVFIGEGSLLAQCADLFRAAGHEVRAVVTEEPLLLEWAGERGLATIDPSADLVTLLSAVSFQYLFSVVNLWVLPAALLALPQRLAVNFHDGPLPRYAGVHATSWALIHGERAHGITWHTMEPEVDAGAVLKQVTFDVGPRATALSLNAACYEAALRAFADLIPDLEADTAMLQPQDQRSRSYFGRLRRPRATGVLDWQRPVHELDALVRALDFGPYQNPLGLPKLICPDGSVVVVQKTTPSGDAAPAAPGTVLAIDDRAIVVSGADRTVALQRFATLEGARVDTAALAARGIEAGAQLPSLTPEQSARLNAVQRAVTTHEPFWVSRLATITPPSLADHWAHDERPDDPAPGEAVVRRALPARVREALQLSAGPVPVGDAAALGLAAFLGTLHVGALCDLAFRDHSLAALLDGALPVFAPAVPFRVGSAGGAGAGSAFSAVRDELDRIRAAGTYALDLPARIPALRARVRSGEASVLPIGICVHGAGWACAAPLAEALCVCVEEGGAALRWTAGSRGPQAATLERLAAQFEEFALAAAPAPTAPPST